MFTVYDNDTEDFRQVEEPDPSRSYTYADYLQWRFEERVELIKGQIFKMSPAPNRKHQEVAGRLFFPMYGQFQDHPCRVFAAPFDVRLPVRNRKKPSQITTVVQPDLCVVCDATKLDDQGCCGAPDLVVEILSPGNTWKEVNLKHDLYQEAGVTEYWVVYPVEESIAVFVMNTRHWYQGATLHAGKNILKSVAIPGLQISLADLFPEQEVK